MGLNQRFEFGKLTFRFFRFRFAIRKGNKRLASDVKKLMLMEQLL